MPRAPLHKYVSASFTISGCAVFLCLIGMLIYQQDSVARQIRSSIGHTRDLLNDVNEMNILIRDAERGQRGYILTGMEIYLMPYEAAIENLPTLHEHIQKLAADNPHQQQQLVALWSLMQQKLAELNQSIQLRTASGEEEAKQEVLSDLGRILMTQITLALDAVVDEENRQLAERNSMVERAETMTRLLTVGGSGLAVLFLALAGMTLHRSAGQQRRIEGEKDQQRRELDRSKADSARHADLARYTEALERSNAELDDFAYIASHDLKEPLRGLFNNAKFLLEDYADKLDREGVGRLLRLGYLCQRMEELINNLLYFSRIGRQELAVQPTDLNAVIHDIETMSETTLTERNAAIVIPHELPLVLCDKTRIAEVFRNLIVNAVKYNESTAKVVEVGYCDTMETRGGSEARVFYVKDNGIGIAEEFHDDIFRIFKRLNAEDDDKKGTGVGLTFVRKIVERHGGRIWLDSILGEGTTFYFTIAQGGTYAG